MKQNPKLKQTTLRKVRKAIDALKKAVAALQALPKP